MIDQIQTTPDDNQMPTESSLEVAMPAGLRQGLDLFRKHDKGFIRSVFIRVTERKITDWFAAGQLKLLREGGNLVAAAVLTTVKSALPVKDFSGTIRSHLNVGNALIKRLVKLTGGLQHIASQSTALIPADVDENISDSYRLYLRLLYGQKPVVTGAFTVASFEIMKDVQVAVRGTESSLGKLPCLSGRHGGGS